MLRARHFTLPAALTVALVAGSCSPNPQNDASIDAADADPNGVARCDTPDGSTSCGACYTASGNTIIDCENCLGTDGQPHVLC